MALNPEAVGKKTPELIHDYKWQDVALYALGIGAKRKELDFLYEGRGPKVYPTYAVVPTLAALARLLSEVGGNMLGVVHGGQSIRLHRPFDPNGKLTTVGRVAGVYDLKRMAQASFATETHDSGGNLVAETDWSIIFRMDGGFGGHPPPSSDRVSTPDRPADFTVEDRTTEEQALLYRLNGDLNPLHADPQIGEMAGFGQPILHGLCTYGYVCRAVVHNVCGGDPSALKSFSGQFRKPVFPGDTIITEGWRDGDRVILRASTKERPSEHVFTNASAQIA